MICKPSLALAGAMALALGGTAQALTLNDAFDGQYGEGTGENRGMNIEFFPLGPELQGAFVTGFTYDADGNPLWYTVLDTDVQAGENVIEGDMLSFEGGIFGPGGNAATSTQIGTFSATFSDCNNVEVSQDSDFGTFTADFKRGSSALPPVGADRCAYQRPFAGCPDFATAGMVDGTCVLQGTYTQDINLTNEVTWVLFGAVFIGEKDATDNSNTVTIEAGTRILGATGGGDFLVIARGSKIDAQGSAIAPIVFTGANTASQGAGPGDWGGLVINGFAPVNVCDGDPSDGGPACEAQGEGASGTFGGTNSEDNSGTLRYVRVQFAGDLINDEDELNGIAFQGVGSGTTVDKVQVHRNADDGVEFFGGTVNARRLVLTHNEDDSIDWTHGWTGKVQYAVVRQIADPDIAQDQGIEADNYDDGNANLPQSQPALANITLIGDGVGDNGVLLKEGTGGNLTNMLVHNFGTCLTLEEAQTLVAAGTPNALTGVLTVENTRLSNCGANFGQEASPAYTTQAFFQAQPGNTTGNVTIENGIFLPEGSPLLSGQGFQAGGAFDDAFFDKVDYIGAVRDKASAYTNGWTIYIND